MSGGFSHGAMDKVYFYAGRAHHFRALQKRGHGHRWAGHHEKGDTLCTRRDKRYRGRYRYRGRNLYQVRVHGVINSHSIYHACRRHRMRPLCDHAGYKDGRCSVVGGGWHWSHRNHNRRHGVDVQRTKFVFFYTRNGRALLNTGRSHRWTNGWDRNGVTMCVKGGHRRKHTGLYYIRGGRWNRFCRTYHHSFLRCDVHHRHARRHASKFRIHKRHGWVALRPTSTNRWCADEGHNVRCNRPWIHGWERFRVSGRLRHGHTFALKGGRHRRWCADEVHRIRCNRPWIRAHERFTLYNAP